MQNLSFSGLIYITQFILFMANSIKLFNGAFFVIFRANSLQLFQVNFLDFQCQAIYLPLQVSQAVLSLAGEPFTAPDR